LDELKELNDKIQNEELLTKLDKLQSKKQTKNLEQLVELTKRFYVERESQQLTNGQAEKQDQLSMTKGKQTGKARRY
jgi:GTP-binding protein EngB required for normal cell division